jgi:hypothetical protein
LLEKDNYYLELENGEKNTTQELKNERTYLEGQAFRIVPIGNDLVEFAVQSEM